MAETILPRKIYIAEAGRVPFNSASSKSFNISKYKADGFALLVFARLWGANDNGFGYSRSLYLVSGIQNGLYQGCDRVSSYGSNAPTVTLSGDTLTITWVNKAAGTYAIIPLFTTL